MRAPSGQITMFRFCKKKISVSDFCSAEAWDLSARSFLIFMEHMYKTFSKFVKICRKWRINMALSNFHDEIHQMNEDGMSYAEMESEITRLGGPTRGCSERSIRRYCKMCRINPKSKKLPEQEDIAEIKEALDICGPSPGRRILKGYLESKKIIIGWRKITMYQRLFGEQSLNQRRQQVR